ncbi:hypothetical protein Tco_1548770 [Tanacetum coccineum]
MLDQHRGGMHKQFSQILTAIEKSRTLMPKPCAQTFAIITRSGTSTRNHPYLTPPRPMIVDPTEGTVERGIPEGYEPSHDPYAKGFQGSKGPSLQKEKLKKPFIATVRIVIEVHEGKLSLRIRSETVTFNFGKSMRSKYSHDDYLYYADHIAKLVLEQWVDTVDHKGNDQLPLVISSTLPPLEKVKLLEVLRSHKGAITWTIADIKGIDSSFYTHKILMEDDFKPTVQPQRRVNPNIQEVVKKDVVKILDVGLIYLIFESPWGAKNLASDHLSQLENPDLGKLTRVEIQDLFLEEQLMTISDKNNEPCNALTKSYEGVSLEKKRPKFFDNVIAARQEGIMGLPQPLKTQTEKSSVFLRKLLGTIENNGLTNLTKHCGPFEPRLRPPGITPFRIIYGKACHFPNELENKAYWAIKACNMDLTKDGANRFLQINELDELRLDAYESSISYKEIMKRWHNNRIKTPTQYEKGDKDGNEFILNKHCVKPYQKDALDFDGSEDVNLEDERGVTLKTYEELSDKEKLKADCDLKATNIVLQGLPPDFYCLVNHHKVAKEIWDKVNLHMQGTSLSKQERECQLYDEFDKFSQVKGETLYEYYLRFAQLINDMNIIQIIMQPVQVNTMFLNSLPPEWGKFVTNVKLARDLHNSNYDQLYFYLEQHEAHAKEALFMRERFPDPLALVANYHQP